MSSLKKLASLKYQIMALMNPKKASNRDLAINRHNQLIQFYNTVVSRMSDVDKKFAMDKG